KKKQHYVPQFYLKNFAIHKKSGECSIRCYSKELNKSYNSNITQVAMERYFYDEEDPPEIENYFLHLEGLHSKVYNKIIHNHSIKQLTMYDKFMMAHYIMTQNERTRSARIRNAQMTELLYKYGRHGIDLPPYESLDEEYKKWLLESRATIGQINIMFNPIEMEDGTVHYPYDVVIKMAKLGWVLLEDKLKREFFTSDHPVYVHNPPIEDKNVIRGYGMSSYTAESVEIFFPLTPRLCLLLFDKVNSDYKNIGLIRQVNQGELDWINTQVIAMAHRTIFTKKNDFQFVRDCVKKHPELKDPNRMRLNL
ncbi:MAG TPA: DUF4238 domain-containing protein, partial [bacterium]|nr:DUF4238 domain-containing protein [bacterium]